MRRAVPLLMALVFASAATFGALPGVRPPIVSAATAQVWANPDSFIDKCNNASSLPTGMANRATTALVAMGYATYETVGRGFTVSAVLAGVSSDSAIYVMSHGDVYNYTGGLVNSAFLQDPLAGSYPPCGKLGYDRVYASAIKSHNQSHLINFAFMSTCYLGSTIEHKSGLNTSGTYGNNMPDAFGIQRSQGTSQLAFYVGYVWETDVRSMNKFEGYFFPYIASHPGKGFYDAFTYAAARGPYIGDSVTNKPFVAAWFGNPFYAGPNYPANPGDL